MKDDFRDNLEDQTRDSTIDKSRRDDMQMNSSRLNSPEVEGASHSSE